MKATSPACPRQRAGAILWNRTDLTPKDVDTAQIYDGFSILTLLWMEAMQFCKPGEAAAFVEGGARLGRLVDPAYYVNINSR